MPKTEKRRSSDSTSAIDILKLMSKSEREVVDKFIQDVVNSVVIKQNELFLSAINEKIINRTACDLCTTDIATVNDIHSAKRIVKEEFTGAKMDIYRKNNDFVTELRNQKSRLSQKIIDAVFGYGFLIVLGLIGLGIYVASKFGVTIK